MKPRHALLLLALTSCGDDVPMLDTESSSSTDTTTTDPSAPTLDGTDTGESSGSSESSGTTGPQPCRNDGECLDPDAPFCGTNGVCSTCDATDDPDAACAGVDPDRPLCVGDTCV